MPDHGGPGLFRLHFKGAATEGRTLPAALLVRAINSLQRIVRLLDSFDEIRQSVQYQDYLSEKHARHQYQDYLPEDRLRHLVSRKIRHRFELFCQTPEKGSFALPVAIGHSQRYGVHPTNVELETICNKFYQFTESIGTVNADRLCKIVPDSDYRELLIQYYRSALPPIGTDIALSIEDGYGRPILDGETGMECIRILPHEIIKIQDLTLCNIRYHADPPLRFQVSVDRNRRSRNRRSRLYYLWGDFGIELSAESRPELEEALDSTLDILWEEYAQERPERLSGDARELRLGLLDRIRRTT